MTITELTTPTTHLDITAPEQDRLDEVYARFASDLHPFVREALYYHAQDLQDGRMKEEDFHTVVMEFASYEAEQDASLAKTQAVLAGILKLIEAGEFVGTSFERTLRDALQNGNAGLLARFVVSQAINDPKHAAVSFLAWYHAKALFDLEDLFQVNLDEVRGCRDATLFGSTEGELALCEWAIDN